MEDRVFQLEECVREYQAALVVSEQDNIQLRTGSSTSNCPGPSRRTTVPGSLPGRESRQNHRTPVVHRLRRPCIALALTVICVPRPLRTGLCNRLELKSTVRDSKRLRQTGSDEGKPSRPTLPQGDRTELTLPPAGGRIGGNAEGDAVALAATEDDSRSIASLWRSWRPVDTTPNRLPATRGLPDPASTGPKRQTGPRRRPGCRRRDGSRTSR